MGAIHGKLAVTFHGVDVSSCLSHDPTYYRHLFSTGDLFLCVSDHWRQTLIAHGCPAERTTVHRMGIDPQAFSHVARRREPTGPARVLTVGRLVEKKGIEYGLRAVAQVTAQNIPLHYTIVGDGPLRTSLQELARSLGISEHVTFLGSRPQHEVLELVRQAHIFLAPSVTDTTGDQEGIPVSLMEAMATGLPVVSSFHSGIPELVDHGVSGLLAPEGDAGAVAELMEALLTDDVLYGRLAANGRLKVLARHHIETLNDQLVDRFQALACPEMATARSL